MAENVLLSVITNLLKLIWSAASLTLEFNKPMIVQMCRSVTRFLTRFTLKFPLPHLLIDQQANYRICWMV